jgi:hypothetical protein
LEESIFGQVAKVVESVIERMTQHWPGSNPNFMEAACTWAEPGWGNCSFLFSASLRGPGG